jgi:hypothetical protein
MLNANNRTAFEKDFVPAIRRGMIGLSLFVTIVAACATSLIEQAARSYVVFALLRGLVGSMAIAGNVHAFSLCLAATINFLFYFLLCLAVGTIIQRLRARRVHTSKRNPQRAQV